MKGENGGSFAISWLKYNLKAIKSKVIHSFVPCNAFCYLVIPYAILQYFIYLLIISMRTERTTYKCEQFMIAHNINANRAHCICANSLWLSRYLCKQHQVQSIKVKLHSEYLMAVLSCQNQLLQYLFPKYQ